MVQLVIGTKIVGKQNIESGKKTNQTLVVIPHTQLVKVITDKAELLRIKVTVTEASYTSNRSFLDLGPSVSKSVPRVREVKVGCFGLGIKG